MVETDVKKMPEAVAHHARLLSGRCMLVHRATPLKAEFVVRGYTRRLGLGGVPEDRRHLRPQAARGPQGGRPAPEPILTPTTKAPHGQHDENITIHQLAHMLGVEVASKAGALAIDLYNHAAALAEDRGIILADTKLEFGIHRGDVMLIDEAFTPDSSRFWGRKDWKPGKAPPSYDKQIVRDALLEMSWNKQPPAPMLPEGRAAQRRASATSRSTSCSRATSCRDVACSRLGPRQRQRPASHPGRARGAARARHQLRGAASSRRTARRTRWTSWPAARASAASACSSAWPAARRTCRRAGGAHDAAVIGVPIPTDLAGGLDSLLSIVQMPAGIPVAAVAAGKSGGRNAALLAASILSVADGARGGPRRRRRSMADKVLGRDREKGVRVQGG
jgi:phosphoribosylaminoimidazole-succinocarboxamide synthase